MLSFVLSLCYYVVSVWLRLPCTPPLWYFHKKKIPSLRRLEVAIKIIFTIKLATSDSPEVVLSRQWGILCWYLLSCVYQMFCARIQIKLGEAVRLLREEMIRSYCGSCRNPALCKQCQGACLVLQLEIPVCFACVWVSYFRFSGFFFFK